MKFSKHEDVNMKNAHCMHIYIRLPTGSFVIKKFDIHIA